MRSNMEVHKQKHHLLVSNKISFWLWLHIYCKEGSLHYKKPQRERAVI